MKNNFSTWDAGGGSRSIVQSLNLFTSRNLFKSLKSILMVVALLSLSSNVWGADVTAQWTATSGGLGTGIGSGTITDNQGNSWSYTRTLKSGASYTNWQSNCIQLGKNGGVENLTITTSAISGTIKSVMVECSSYNNAHKVSITVGSTSYLSSTATAKWTTITSIGKSSGGTASGAITISVTDGTRAFYIKSITVVYEKAAPAEPFTVTFYTASGQSQQETESAVGAGVTPPTMQAACGDWEFQGWSKTESDDAESTDELILETLSSGKYYPSSNVTLYPVYTMEETIESDVSDEITQSTTGLSTSGSGGYTAWSSKTVTSDAVYAGQSNKAVSYLQLRNQSPSGIISTSSGGILKKVTVAWASNNTSERYVTIFGKKSAYTACTNLYDNSAKGTSLGTIVYETSTELDNLNKNDEYTYVGVLASAAVYINKITVTWAVEEDVTYYYSYPSCGPSTYTLLFSELKIAQFLRYFLSHFFSIR